MDTQKRLRGHAFLPPKKVLEKAPGACATERIPFEDKQIVAHYFSGGADYWIAEIWQEPPEEGEAGGQWLGFGYAKLASQPEGQEWGIISLTELEGVRGRTPQGLPVIVERDMHWQPVKFSEIAGVDHPAQREAEAAAEPEPEALDEPMDPPADTMADYWAGHPEPRPGDEHDPAYPVPAPEDIAAEAYQGEAQAAEPAQERTAPVKTRFPLDASAAFTALLDLSPEYGAMDGRDAEKVTAKFLEDWYASDSKDMFAFARDEWGHLDDPAGSFTVPGDSAEHQEEAPKAEGASPGGGQVITYGPCCGTVRLDPPATMQPHWDRPGVPTLPLEPDEEARPEQLMAGDREQYAMTLGPCCGQRQVEPPGAEHEHEAG